MDFVLKPSGSISLDLATIAPRLLDALRAAAAANPAGLRHAPAPHADHGGARRAGRAARIERGGDRRVHRRPARARRDRPALAARDSRRGAHRAAHAARLHEELRAATRRDEPDSHRRGRGGGAGRARPRVRRPRRPAHDGPRRRRGPGDRARRAAARVGRAAGGRSALPLGRRSVRLVGARRRAHRNGARRRRRHARDSERGRPRRDSGSRDGDDLRHAAAPRCSWRARIASPRCPRSGAASAEWRSRRCVMFRDGVARVLVFRVGGERFAVSLPAVDEVIESPELQRMPDAPEHVLGVATLRGELLSVYDPLALLGASGGAGAVRRRRRSIGRRGDARLQPRRRSSRRPCRRRRVRHDHDRRVGAARRAGQRRVRRRCSSVSCCAARS